MAAFRGITLPPDWHAFKDSLIYRQYGRFDITHKKDQVPEGNQVRIAGFDFDDTLVRKHDHVFAFPGVVQKLKALNDEGFLIAVFTNEALDHFKTTKAIQNAVSKKLLRLHKFAVELDCPIQIFVATRYDGFRKPSEADLRKQKPAGGKLMWDKLIELSGLDYDDIDMAGSIYVGDAAGRRSDFSDADMAFAKCVGVKFSLPEDLFASTGILKEHTASSTKGTKRSHDAAEGRIDDTPESKRESVLLLSD